MKSGLHKLDGEEAGEHADLVELEEGIYEDTTGQGSKPNKKHRGSGSEASSATEVAAIVAETLRQSKQTPASTPQLALTPTPNAAASRIMIRRGQLSTVIDACARAAAAARHAHRLSAAAAQAFHDEAVVLDEIGLVLKANRDSPDN